MSFCREKIVGFLIVFVILLSIYLYTIAPTVPLWDCGEFIACSHILGVPHPPGTPFYVIIGRVFDIFLPFKEVAKRVNFISALSSALAGGFLYIVILLVFQRFRENKGKKLSLAHHLFAIFSSIGAGLCFSVWDSSVEAEVYTPSILIIILCLWLILYWDDKRGTRGYNNYLWLVVYLISLSFGIHLLPLLLIPAVLIFVIIRNPKAFKNPKLICFSIILILVGVSTYCYLMIRAKANPSINEADPSTLSALWDVISREQYGPMKILPRKTQIDTHLSTFVAFFEQVKIFFKYFSWQFFPYPRELTNNLLKYSSIVGTYLYVFLGLLGIYAHFKRDKDSFWLFFILYILLTLGLVTYLNLKFSPSDPNPAHQDREVRERDYFWAPAFFLFMFYVSIGLYSLYEEIKKRKALSSYFILGLAFLLGFLPLISNIKSHVNRRGDWIASDYAHNLLITPEDNSILFTYGDNDTFPVWFLQEVKSFRKFDPVNKKGVRIANFSLMNTSWYIKQLKLSGIPMDFDSPFRGTGIERKYHSEKREGLTNLEFEDWVIENIAPIMTEDRKWLRVSDIVVRNIILSSLGITPSSEDFLIPADSFVNKYIKEDFNPSINIYFSFPVETYSTRVFGRHLELEGFAYRLVGKKGKRLVNYERMFDNLVNKFKTSYCENPNIYTGPAEKQPLGNHSFLYLNFGEYALQKFINRKELSQAERDTLILLEEIFKKAFLFSIDSKLSIGVTTSVAENLKKIYSLIKEERRATDFCDSLLYLYKKYPALHLLRGEMHLFKGEMNIEEAEKDFEEAKRSFELLLKDEEYKPLGYVGLVKLYYNDSNKLKEVLIELSKDSVALETTFFVVMRYEPKCAIKLLNLWKELYPGDASKVDLLIEKLQEK
ncbi:MAG: DUF2723 domain-containing protein [candidate division WOR-3 bacterium]